MTLTMIGMAMAAASADKAAHALQPSGQWTLDYSENSCVLTRPFGSGDEQVTFGFRLLPNMLASDGLLVQPKRRGAVDGRLLMRIDPGSARVESRFRTLQGKDGAAIAIFGIDADDMEKIAAAQQIELNLAGRKIALAAKGMDKAIAATKACLDDLLTTWKIDPAINANVAKRPRPVGTPGNWVTDDDYPSGSVVAGEQGSVTFRLDIDAKGTPSGCTVVAGSGYKALNEATCELMMKRARFRPAELADGAPTPYFYISRFTWRVAY
ncbi:energy transducer TonB [Sphingomonas turrisvirgatae]|uniref:TonB C-terminal domain-containing protein n=1 Tax=Sphingomonas turrisvirgatae TaxID=1888892 RepID=A0A1E3LT25_9SPHN|nr:energy transducer TonB [Sphingomonas turrisvirgatae]ODP36879.1 hypothetical protein BFL28_03995 [Sphingomonas turrisvirgatae]